MGDLAPALRLDFEKRYASGVSITATLDASLRPDTILVLFGPSGSGKTTILRSIAGLETPDRGTIRYDEETWFDGAAGHFVEPQRRRIGYVFQDAALFPHLTVAENVRYGTSHDGLTRARGDELLALFDIESLATRYPRQLSIGQSQRVALARALAVHPRLLLLDEPFAALDTPARLLFRALLRSAVQRVGAAAILVTHDRNEAIALGDQLAVLVDGRIRQFGTVLDVFRRPANLDIARSVGVDAVLPARVEGAEDGLLDLRVGPVRLRAVDSGVEGLGRDVFACIRAEDVTLERTAVSGASARNHLPGRIVSVTSEGPLERVTLDCGFPLTALVTRQAREELDLQVGRDVVAAVKATTIHLVARA